MIQLNDEKRKYVKETLALMNSMIHCGDEHSEGSKKRFDE